MNAHLLLSFTALLAAPPSAPVPAPPARVARPADSVVQVIVSQRYPNVTQPWAPSKATGSSGSGVVVAGNKILTNAHVVEAATEIYVRSKPGGDKYSAKVVAVATESDLAVLTINDKKFFEDHPPLPTATKLPAASDNVDVYGFPVGGTELSVTKGIVSRVGYLPSFGNVVIQVSAAINPGNSGGPAIVDGKMIGLVFSRLQAAQNIGYVIPTEEVDFFLETLKRGPYKGKIRDATRTTFQRLENESLRAMLKLGRRTRGVLAEPPRPAEPGNPFQENDVMIRVGDHDIDNDGWVRLANGLRVPYSALIPRLARGNFVPVTILRKGERVSAKLPVSTENNLLIRSDEGHPVPYFIHGPLAFSPVKSEAVQTYFTLNPAAIFSPLYTRRYDRVNFPGEELVVITSRMFDHKIGRGYGDPVGQILEDVNGQKVKNLRHLVEILRDSKEEFLKFRFSETGAEMLVFRRTEMNEATNDVLEDAGIAPSRRGSKDMLKVWNNGRTPARSPGPKTGSRPVRKLPLPFRWSLVNAEGARGWPPLDRFRARN